MNIAITIIKEREAKGQEFEREQRAQVTCEGFKGGKGKGK